MLDSTFERHHPKTHAKANLDAIRVLSAINNDGREATDDELQTLSGYCGWGALGGLFDERKSEFKSERESLLDLVGENAYQILASSILDSYYTPSLIVKAMWAAVKRTGFKGGRVLDPAVGHGGLLEQCDLECDWTVIDRCRVSADIAAARFPDARVINKPFETVCLDYNQFDLVFFNPPYGDIKLTDYVDRDLAGLNIHNFFMRKSANLLREGGLMAVVISHNFLDAENESTRRFLLDQMELLDAVRLPASVFSGYGTDIVTDILILRKNAQFSADLGEWAKVDTFVDSDGAGAKLNKLYCDAPGKMLGNPEVVRDRFGKHVMSLAPDGNLVERLRQFIRGLPDDAYQPMENEPCLNADHDPAIVAIDSKYTPVFGFAIDESGSVIRRLQDVNEERAWERVEMSQTQAKRVSLMLPVRDALMDLLNAENDVLVASDQIDQARARLVSTYGRWKKQYGALHGRMNGFMSTDPSFSTVLSLELDYDEGISASKAKKEGVEVIAPSWSEAPILSRRVCYPTKDQDHADSPIEGLALCIRKYGRLDLDVIADLCGQDIDQVITELSNAGEIYLVNAQKNEWELADELLAGNLYERIEALSAQSGNHPSLQVTLDFLNEKLPKPVDAADIVVGLGASWVDPQYIADFCSHLVDAQIKKPVYAGGCWYIDFKDYHGVRAKQVNVWGTNRRSCADLVDRMLNNKPVTVYDTIHESQVLNVEATTEAELKREEILAEWNDWIMLDSDRRIKLANSYNRTFNAHVLRDYDGRVLLDGKGLLRGQNPDIQWDKHQIDTIYRGVREGRLLVDEAVGAGKTFMALAIGYVSRQMGLINKPLYVVPNNLVTAWASDAVRLFPSASILRADERDLTPKNRRRFFASMAVGDYDFIILPQSAFTFLSAPSSYVRFFIQEQMDDLSMALMNTDKSDHFSTRKLESAKRRLSERLKRTLNAPRRDPLLCFENVGVDCIFCDEAHAYKNLAFVSSLNNVAGLGNPNGSQRALDLFTKVRYLQDMQDGRGYFPLTATPITNSVVEMFNLFRYMDYDGAKDRGIQYLDAWVANFGRVTTRWELSVSGGYKMKTRLSTFVNVPDLNLIYRSFAEVMTKRDLRKQFDAEGKAWPEPEIEGGKPKLVVCARSAAQSDYFDELLKRAENMGSVTPDVDNWLKLTSDAMAASLDLRLRLPAAGDAAESKINQCVNEVFSIYQANDYRRGTQIIFCDLGTPGAGKQGHCVYDDLKNKLIAMGIPAHQIAFIHDANTAVRKQSLFRRVNEGAVRVLICSTEKGGTGMNVQRRLVALHMLDLPWTPSGVEQRTGRGVRRGNLFHEQDNHFKMKVLWYATKETLDAMRYQTVEIKARFIDQIRSGDNLARIMDEGETGAVSSFGEMKARISGNPLILAHFDLDRRVNKLEVAERAHRRAKYNAESFLANHQDYQDKAADQLHRWSLDQTVVEAYGDELVLEKDGEQYRNSGDDRSMSDALLDVVNGFLAEPKWRAGSLTELCRINGLSFRAIYSGSFYSFRLKGESVHWKFDYHAKETISLTGLVQRISNALKRLPEVRQQILDGEARMEREMHTMSKVAQSSFEQGVELNEVKTLLRGVLEALSKDASEVSDEHKALYARLIGSASPAHECVEATEPARPVEAPRIFALPGRIALALPKAA